MVLVKDLKQKAKERGIVGYSKMNKAELEKALGIPKPSAYRSMRLASLGLVKLSPEEESRLKQWKNEKWVNLTAQITDKKKLPCGTKGKRQKQLNLPTVCRPTLGKHSVLAKDVSKAQLEKAIEMKKRGERIIWSKL